MMPQNAWWVIASWVLILGGILVYGITQLNRQKRLEQELARERRAR